MANSMSNPALSSALANFDKGLADDMQLKTSAQHRLAEKSGVVSKILKKSVKFSDYVVYLRNLSAVYEIIERQSTVHPSAYDSKVFLDKRLARFDSISQDLDNLVGRSTWQSLPIVPATKNYCDHINYVKSHRPNATIGHLYVRYLGDLNGGRLMPGLLKEALNLDYSCLNFYRYPEIDNLDIYKEEYREAINRISVDTNNRVQIVRTAAQAFQNNIDLSVQVQACRVNLKQITAVTNTT